MSRKHTITVESLLNDLAEDRTLAREVGQVGAAIQATQLSAKLVGLLVDRKESGAPGDFAALTTVDEVMAVVRAELGEGAAAALSAALARVEPDPPAVEATHTAGDTVN